MPDDYRRLKLSHFMAIAAVENKRIMRAKVERLQDGGRSRVQDALVVVEKSREPVTVTITFKDGPHVGK
jgi:hypothetical protein